MSWRERTDKVASFRGVKAFYREVEGEIGRRTVVHEFPGRDLPQVEDLGRRARRLSLELFVLGEDYDVARDKLRAELEKPGPGLLVHPYWGERTVSVDGPVRVRESTAEGGIARFTVNFVEHEEAAFLDLREDSGSLLTTAATKAGEAVSTQFLDGVVTAGITDAFEEAVDATEDLSTDMLLAVEARIAAALGGFALPEVDIESVPDLAPAIASLFGGCFDAIATVTAEHLELLEEVGSEAGLATAGSVIAAATRVMLLKSVLEQLGAFGATLPELPASTPRQRAAAESQRQLIRLMRATAAVEACRVLPQLSFDSYDQVVSVRTVVTGVLGGVIAEATLPDALYGPLMELRALVVRHLGEAAALPGLVDFTPGATLPALVLAHRIYGDAAREAELLARNPSIADPTAVPGGVPLQVLADA